MSKRKKTKRKSRSSKRSRTQRRVVERKDLSIRGEARHVVDCARRFDSRVIAVSGLVFFSTPTGDAWALDPEDKLALCLAREGEAQPYRIVEAEASFGIEWNAVYTIQQGVFVVAEKTGKMIAYYEYPIQAILEAQRQATRRS